ncbi:MAG: ABC transporter permease subunit [Candidatus Korarchaeum sp.]|nr:ABC transporter permease subunit [Candidatus Korarchaeum sp.]MDW8036064.1 ABC transporter permease subunit [Candidatus Korarchaeum sp.]
MLFLERSLRLGELLSLFTLFSAWVILSLSGTLPSPRDVTAYIIHLEREKVLSHVTLTLFNSISGFSLALISSLALGVVSHRSYVARGFSNGLCSIFNSTSALIWSLVLVSTVGILSPLSPILVVAAVTFPQLLSAVSASLDSVDERLLEMVRSLGGSPADEYFDVIIPSSLPVLISSSRVAIGLGLRISVVAEAFGSSGGIGYMIMRSYNLVDVTGVLAWSLLLIILVVAVDHLILRYIEERSRRWLR